MSLRLTDRDRVVGVADLIRDDDDDDDDAFFDMTVCDDDV